MKDRQPTKPNRVLITPESGSPFYATMTRADEPTEEGTALNKFNLLKDETAEALGLTPDAVPDDAFAMINSAKIEMHLLWENASPTSSFAAQTVELDLSEYEFVLIGATHRYTNDIPHDGRTSVGGIFRKGYSTELMLPWKTDGSSSAYGYIRRSVTVSVDGIAFGGGYYAKTAGDWAAIPVYIYGIKGVQA